MMHPPSGRCGLTMQPGEPLDAHKYLLASSGFQNFGPRETAQELAAASILEVRGIV